MYGDYSYVTPGYTNPYSTMPIDTIPAEELEAVGTVVAGAVAGVAIVVLAISFIIGIISIIANWKIFTKAGEKGWKCLIPIYNTVVLFKIAGISPLLIFVYFASIIPFVGWIAVLGVTIYLMHNLAKAFGKDAGFTVGLVLLNTIFTLILAFDKSEYQLNKATEVVSE